MMKLLTPVSDVIYPVCLCCRYAWAKFLRPAWRLCHVESLLLTKATMTVLMQLHGSPAIIILLVQGYLVFLAEADVKDDMRSNRGSSCNAYAGATIRYSVALGLWG